MKRIYTLLTVLAIGFAATAQTTVTDYFMNTSHTRTLLNPALQPKNGHFGMPLLSNIFVDVKTNSINLDHMVFDNNGQKVLFMHPSVSSDDFLSGLGENNYLALDMRYTLFSAGWYTKGGFWFLDGGLRIEGDMNLPKGLFEFMKKGFSTLDRNDDPIRYDLKNFGLGANVFGEIGLGHSRSFLDDNLQVGLKAKLLLGLGNFDVNMTTMDVEYGYDRWTVQSQASMKMAGFKPKYNRDEVFDGIDDYSPSISGYGFGIDVGAVYNFDHLSDIVISDVFADILSRTKFSFALTDMGLISWAGDNTGVMKTSETETVIDFSDFEFSQDGSLEDQIDDAMDSLNEITKFREDSDAKGYSTGLRTNMNIGLEYEFWKDNMTAGLLSSTRFGHNRTTTEFTASANYNPNKGWFATSFSYSFVHSQFQTFGLAIHLAPSKGVNLFLASDYVIPHVNSSFFPTTSRAVNFQMGVVFPMGSKK